jgi:dTDP-glucose pyrophosphorylase
MIRTGVILAAGAGTRLGELAHRSSKAMITVAGKPLIDRVARRLRQAGLERLIVVAHVDDAALQAHAASTGTEVAVQSERCGIADALVCAAPSLSEEAAFLACACDSLFAVAELRGLLAVAEKFPQDAIVAVQEVTADATVARSAVVREGELVRAIVEKPAPGSIASSLVALPLYVLPHRMLARAAAVAPLGGECYLSTALTDEVEAGGRVRWIEFRQRWEVTTAEDVRQLEALLSDDRSRDRA